MPKEPITTANQPQHWLQRSIIVVSNTATSIIKRNTHTWDSVFYCRISQPMMENGCYTMRNKLKASMSPKLSVGNSVPDCLEQKWNRIYLSTDLQLCHKLGFLPMRCSSDDAAVPIGHGLHAAVEGQLFRLPQGNAFSLSSGLQCNWNRDGKLIANRPKVSSQVLPQPLVMKMPGVGLVCFRFPFKTRMRKNAPLHSSLSTEGA